MKRKRFSAVIAAVAVAGSLGVAGTVSASGNGVGIGGGSDDDGAQLRCPGGIARLSHVFDEAVSVFPGDPSPRSRSQRTFPTMASSWRRC